MSIEQRRRDALSDLQALLLEGVEPQDALREVSETYDLKLAVLESVGSGMINNLEALRATNAASKERWQRRARQDNLVRAFRIKLQSDNNADAGAFLLNHSEAKELTSEEHDDVFLRCLDAWLEINVRD